MYGRRPVLRVEYVAPESKKHEVAVHQPLEEIPHFLDLGSAPRHRSLRFLEIGDDLPGRLPHRMEVGRRRLQQTEIVGGLFLQLGGGFVRHRSVEHDENRRGSGAVAGSIADGDDMPFVVTFEHDDGVQEGLDGERSSVHALAQGLDDERRIGHAGEQVGAVFRLVGRLHDDADVLRGRPLDQVEQLAHDVGDLCRILFAQPVLGHPPQHPPGELLERTRRIHVVGLVQLEQHFRDGTVLRRRYFHRLQSPHTR